MMTKHALGVLAALLFMVLCVPSGVLASEIPGASEEGRTIYVGDLITLEITAGGMTAEELREAFREFELVELREEAGRFTLAIRTFEPGEYKVQLADKEIVVTVGSTLEDFRREDVFEGGAQVMEAGVDVPWRILFYAAAGVFALSGGVMLFKAVWRRKTKPQTPYRVFLQSTGALDVESDGYLAELTLHLKSYLESLYGLRIIGKTSAEIMDVLSGVRALEPVLPQLGEWLAECDRMKFSGMRVSGERKRAHYETLLALVETINRLEEQKEGAA